MLLDRICTRWPGYTLSSALAEDGQLIYQTLGLIDLLKGDNG